MARHVIPEVNGPLNDYRESREFVVEHRDYFERAGQAIMSKIMENDRANPALKEQANGSPPSTPTAATCPRPTPPSRCRAPASRVAVSTSIVRSDPYPQQR